MKTKIIVCYHKPCQILKNDVLLPLQVGRKIATNEIPQISGDDSGENISYKNSSYCELTGMYWLWKNIEADNYGLFHYRRLLDVSEKYTLPIYSAQIDVSDWSNNIFDRLMDKYDIILPQKNKFDISLYERYKEAHYIKDLEIVLDIIKRDYPEYIPAIENCIHKNEEYCCNMFVMKKEIFNEYCEWLFDILKKAEKEIDISNYSPYQARIFGFLGERLENIFIEYKIETTQNLKIKHVNNLLLTMEAVKHIKFGIGEYIDFPNKSVLKIFGIKITRNKRNK